MLDKQSLVIQSVAKSFMANDALSKESLLNATLIRFRAINGAKSARDTLSRVNQFAGFLIEVEYPRYVWGVSSILISPNVAGIVL